MTANTLLPKIFSSRNCDSPDELEQEWQERYSEILGRFRDQSDQYNLNVLISSASNSNQEHFNITTGLIYGILVDRDSAPCFIEYLSHVTRDKFSHCILQLNRLILERYAQLLDTSKEQCVWMVIALIPRGAPDVHRLIAALLRHVVIGNVQKFNIWLIQQLLDMFSSYKDWLYEQSDLIPYVVYTFLSVINDHTKPQYQSIRDREVNLCVQLIRENFEICRGIGRDLIRLLYNISRIPEIEQLIHDVFMSFQSPNVSYLRSICHIPTPKKYLVSRITPEVETWLKWMMTNVRAGCQARYQVWFSKKHLPTPESEYLIPELIRWICAVHHPTNAILQSDIVPRWAILGWLLKSIKSPYITANARQSLFYDWFFFVPSKDSIMNVEPGMLLMMNSLNRYADITTSLCEYLLNSIDSYMALIYQPIREDIRRSVIESVKCILDKKVILSLEPLFLCTQVPQAVRDMMKRLLEGFVPVHQTRHSQQVANPFEKQSVTNQPTRSHLNPIEGSVPTTPSTTSAIIPTITLSLGLNDNRNSILSSQSPKQMPTSTLPTNAASLSTSSLSHQIYSQSIVPDPNSLPELTKDLRQLDAPSPSSSTTINPLKATSTSQSLNSTEIPTATSNTPSLATTTADTTTHTATTTISDENQLFQAWKSAVSSPSTMANSGMNLSTKLTPHGMNDAQIPTQPIGHTSMASRRIELLSPYYHLLQQLASIMELSEYNKAQLVFEQLLESFLENVSSDEQEYMPCIQELAQTLVTSLSTELIAPITCARLLKSFDLKNVSDTKHSPKFNDEEKDEKENDDEISANGVDHNDPILNQPLVYVQLFSVYVANASPSMLALLTHMRNIEPSFGYRLICYLLASQSLDFDHSLYGSIDTPIPIRHHSTSFEDKPLTKLDLQQPLPRAPSTQSYISFLNLSRSINQYNSLSTKCIDDSISVASFLEPYITWLNYRCHSKSMSTNLEVEKCFLEDAQSLAESDLDLFNRLSPFMFLYLTEYAVGNVKLIELVMTCWMPIYLRQHMMHLSIKTYEMIGTQVGAVMLESLQWDSMAQYATWCIINTEFYCASSYVVEHVTELLNAVDPSEHVECLLGLQQYLGIVPPERALTDALLVLPLSFTSFVGSVLTRWVLGPHDGILLPKCLVQTLSSLTSSPNKNSTHLSTINADLSTTVRLSLMHLSIWVLTLKEEASKVILLDTTFRNKILQVVNTFGFSQDFLELLNMFEEQKSQKRSKKRKRE